MPAGNQTSENLLVLQRNNGSQIKLLFLHLHHYTKKNKKKQRKKYARFKYPQFIKDTLIQI